MAAALVGYLGKLIPGLGQHRALCIGIGLGAMWLVTFINMRGVKEAGLFQSVTTYTKLVPFVAISLFGLLWVDWTTFAVLNPSDQPFLGALAHASRCSLFSASSPRRCPRRRC
jgi:amino acid transporter